MKKNKSYFPQRTLHFKSVDDNQHNEKLEYDSIQCQNQQNEEGQEEKRRKSSQINEVLLENDLMEGLLLETNENHMDRIYDSYKSQNSNVNSHKPALKKSGFHSNKSLNILNNAELVIVNTIPFEESEDEWELNENNHDLKNLLEEYKSLTDICTYKRFIKNMHVVYLICILLTTIIILYTSYISYKKQEKSSYIILNILYAYIFLTHSYYITLINMTRTSNKSKTRKEVDFQKSDFHFLFNFFLSIMFLLRITTIFSCLSYEFCIYFRIFSLFTTVISFLIYYNSSLINVYLLLNDKLRESDEKNESEKASFLF